MSQGMRTSVAKALGYSPPIRGVAETVACVCGYQLGPADFTTDTIGRLVQRCPHCRHTIGVTPNGAILREVEAARAKEAKQREVRQASKAHAKPKVPPRECENTACRKLYQPNTLTQRFCSNLCVNSLRKIKHFKGSLGVATNVNSLKDPR